MAEAVAGTVDVEAGAVVVAVVLATAGFETSSEFHFNVVICAV